MITSNTKRKSLIGASMLTVVLCAGCACKDDEAQKKSQEQPAQEQSEGDKKQGLRVDPLGKLTTPGRCIGWTCF